MVHGQFAAWVVSFMALLACWTSRAWRAPKLTGKTERVAGSLPFIAMLPVTIVIQYTLGGLLRHKHTAMHEHLIFAFVVMFFAILAAVILFRTGVPWLRRSAMWILGLILFQVLLGAGAWVTRFGFATTGYVATARSLEQTWLRTSHTVVGMILFATSVVAVARTLRVSSLVSVPRTVSPSVVKVPAATSALGGGAS
jgi:cytochrome c oxidase assembly protein subunit 15